MYPFHVGIIVNAYEKNSTVKCTFWTYAIHINMYLNVISLHSAWNKLCFLMSKNNAYAPLSHPGRIIETRSSKFLFIL